MNYSIPVKRRSGCQLKSSGTEVWKAAAIPLAVFVDMLAFNIMTPRIADDYNYSFCWASDQRLLPYPISLTQ